jgi:hypothetical protein
MKFNCADCFWNYGNMCGQGYQNYNNTPACPFYKFDVYSAIIDKRSDPEMLQEVLSAITKMEVDLAKRGVEPVLDDQSN